MILRNKNLLMLRLTIILAVASVVDTRCPSEIIEDAAARGCSKAKNAIKSSSVAMDPAEWCWRSVSRNGCKDDLDCEQKVRKACLVEVARQRNMGDKYCPPSSAVGDAPIQIMHDFKTE